MSDEMFSGWGIRTLSSRHPSYNPFFHGGFQKFDLLQRNRRKAIGAECACRSGTVETYSLCVSLKLTQQDILNLRCR